LFLCFCVLRVLRVLRLCVFLDFVREPPGDTFL
jgi:hypothetical protein